MIFLAITREGLLNALEIAGTSPSIFWCGADAITKEEFENLKSRNVTRFTYPLKNTDKEILAAALTTIEEHHPNELVWIEQSRQSA